MSLDVLWYSVTVLYSIHLAWPQDFCASMGWFIRLFIVSSCFIVIIYIYNILLVLPGYLIWIRCNNMFPPYFPESSLFCSRLSHLLYFSGWWHSSSTLCPSNHFRLCAGSPWRDPRTVLMSSHNFSYIPSTKVIWATVKIVVNHLSRKGLFLLESCSKPCKTIRPPQKL